MELVFCLFVCFLFVCLFVCLFVTKSLVVKTGWKTSITLNGNLKEQCVKVGIRFVCATNVRLLKVTLCTFILQQFVRLMS